MVPQNSLAIALNENPHGLNWCALTTGAAGNSAGNPHSRIVSSAVAAAETSKNFRSAGSHEPIMSSSNLSAERSVGTHRPAANRWYSSSTPSAPNVKLRPEGKNAESSAVSASNPARYGMLCSEVNIKFFRE
eukprot:Amastigsp_a676354_2257.p6 type:complete len:132 gc:universal Amastigsp_a676354_2257:419-814(+)